MSEFLKQEFDKLLLVGALIGFCGLAAMNGQLSGFGSDAAKTVLGALLGLITGSALGSPQPPKGGAE